MRSRLTLVRLSHSWLSAVNLDRFFSFLCVFQLTDNQAKHVVFLSCIFYLVSSKTIVLEISIVVLLKSVLVQSRCVRVDSVCDAERALWGTRRDATLHIQDVESIGGMVWPWPHVVAEAPLETDR